MQQLIWFSLLLKVGKLMSDCRTLCKCVLITLMYYSVLRWLPPILSMSLLDNSVSDVHSELRQTFKMQLLPKEAENCCYLFYIQCTMVSLYQIISTLVTLGRDGVKTRVLCRCTQLTKLNSEMNVHYPNVLYKNGRHELMFWTLMVRYHRLLKLAAFFRMERNRIMLISLRLLINV